MRTPQRSVIILGAGYAGLLCATRLAPRGPLSAAALGETLPALAAHSREEPGALLAYERLYGSNNGGTWSRLCG